MVFTGLQALLHSFMLTLLQGGEQYSFLDKETEAKTFKYLAQIYITSKDLNIYIYIKLSNRKISS